MLIVYPLENWNTFISVADATTKLLELGGEDKWNKLSNKAKEVMLSRSAFLIKSICNIRENSCVFSDAQVALIQIDQANDGKYLSNIVEVQKYKKAKVGSLSVEYTDIDSSSVNLPSVVNALLSKCLKSNRQVARSFKLA